MSYPDICMFVGDWSKGERRATLAVLNPASGGSYDEAIREANRLSYGLGAFAYTRSLKTAAAAAGDLASDMVSINHPVIALTKHRSAESRTPAAAGKEAAKKFVNTRI